MHVCVCVCVCERVSKGEVALMYAVKTERRVEI
jgi:hypothetical protein